MPTEHRTLYKYSTSTRPRGKPVDAQRPLGVDVVHVGAVAGASVVGQVPPDDVSTDGLSQAVGSYLPIFRVVTDIAASYYGRRANCDDRARERRTR